MVDETRDHLLAFKTKVNNLGFAALEDPTLVPTYTEAKQRFVSVEKKVKPRESK
jgi:hypothetical protein